MTKMMSPYKLAICLLLFVTSTLFANRFDVISDIHLDMSLKTPMPINPAGAGSDLDLKTFHTLLENIAEQAKKQHPDFVLVTGDIVGHNIFIDRTTTVSKTEKTIFHKLLHTFKHTPVIFVFGNNDAYEANYGKFMDQDGNSPYKTAKAAGWGEGRDGFLSLLHRKIKCVAEDRKLGNFYCRINHSPLGIIGFNSIALSPKAQPYHPDIYRDFADLSRYLQLATQHGRKVIIAMHIPPGKNFYNNQYFLMNTKNQPYNTRLIGLLQRYSHTIVVVLAGHTHKDEMKIIARNPAIENSRAIPVLLTPGLSTSHGNHAGFRVYQYNPKSAEVTDYTSYSFSDNGAILQRESTGAATYSFSLDFPSLAKYGKTIQDNVTQSTCQDTAAILKDMTMHYNLNNQPANIQNTNNLWIPTNYCS